MIGLYPICDLDTLSARGIAPVPFFAALLAAAPRPALIQLRAKSAALTTTRAVASELLPLARSAGVPLVVNDHVDLARELGATLVHIGQDDGDPRGMPHGRSTHSEEQLKRALSCGAAPAYVAYGPVFATASKRNAEPTVGVDGLRAAHALTAMRRVPLCAIGGIDASTLAAVAPHCELVAVIGAVVHSDLAEVTARASALGAAFLRARSARS